MTSTIIFENDRFTVSINPKADGYEVINKDTGIVEFEDKMLSACLYNSEGMNSVLKRFWDGLEEAEEAVEEETNVVAFPTEETEE